MSKRIVSCCDGTWDSAGDSGVATNVYKLFKMLSSSPEQVVSYDDGVGSHGLLIEKLLGGAMGFGLFHKIQEAYANIAHVYEPGDSIYLFGFSRGAYVARSVAGMIAAVGLPVSGFDGSLLSRAFDAYRNPELRPDFQKLPVGEWAFDVKIKMVGVWDTVGSLGIPAIVGLSDPLLYGFLDTNLHPDVENAFQALAADERRVEFPPSIWTGPRPPVEGQTLEQVWFSGVHGDIGGGYKESGLSDLALRWMCIKAAACGLAFNEPAPLDLLDAKYALAPIHHSWSLFWGFPKNRENPEDPDVSNTKVANSLMLRYREMEGEYNPRLKNFAQAETVQIVKEV